MSAGFIVLVMTHQDVAVLPWWSVTTAIDDGNDVLPCDTMTSSLMFSSWLT